MNLVIALDELQKARRIAADGQKCLSEQRKIIDRLERGGCDSLDAIQFLEYLEEVQEQYLDHRDRLEQRVLGMVKPGID